MTAVFLSSLSSYAENLKCNIDVFEIFKNVEKIRFTLELKPHHELRPAAQGVTTIANSVKSENGRYKFNINARFDPNYYFSTNQYFIKVEIQDNHKNLSSSQSALAQRINSYQMEGAFSDYGENGYTLICHIFRKPKI